MNKELVADALAQVRLIHLRERRSIYELETAGLSAYCAADVAFLALDEGEETSYTVPDAKGSCLITAGVLAGESSLMVMIKAARSVGLAPVYYAIGDGGENELAERVCGEAGTPISYAKDIAVEEQVSFLSQFQAAISGRHHINLFLVRAGVPFVPLPSNTWKIEETLRMVGYPISPVRLHSDLAPTMKRICAHREAVSIACIKAFKIGRADVERLRRKVATCSF